MLERILEPEVMDSAKEAREYDDMDHSEVNQKFVSDLIAFARTRLRPDQLLDLGDVLDLGTGTAQIPVELCRQHEECRIMAIDMSVSMLELAVYNIESAGFTERIMLSQVDAKNMEFEDQMFDTVISNSITHHLENPELVIQEISRVCSVEGTIFVRDLMRPDTADELDHLVKTYAGNESEYMQKLFRDSLHASLTLPEIQAMVNECGFPTDTVAATSDRHWTWQVCRAMTS
ncbi:MAG: class I SAM-dependent methyltransferase [Planctomycetota bacterium]